MAQPPAYNRETDFTERDGDDTNHEAINTELDGAAQSINAIRDNLALIQRDDGGLTPGIVDGDALSQDAFNAVLGATVEAVQASETAANNAALASATAITKAGEASASAAAAAASELASANSAAASATAAQTLFDSIYLGALAADPVVDGNGNPLTDGDFYFNTVAKLVRVYDSSSGGFVAATPSGQFKRQVFVDGVDFVAGTDDTLTLLTDPVTAKNVFVYFDAAYQQTTEWTRSGLDIVFDVPIPLGVTQVEVVYLEAINFGVPGDESVTDQQVAPNAGIDSSKIAHTSDEPNATEVALSQFLNASTNNKNGQSSLTAYPRGSIISHVGDSNTQARPGYRDAYNADWLAKGGVFEAWTSFNQGANGSTAAGWASNILTGNQAAVPVDLSTTATQGTNPDQWANPWATVNAAPQVIIFSLGTNDFRINAGPAQIAAVTNTFRVNIAKLVNFFLEQTSAAIILRMPQPIAFANPDPGGFTDCVNADDAAARSAAMRTVYLEWLNVSDRVRVVDTHKAIFGLRADSVAGPQDPEGFGTNLYDDTLHPSLLGFARIVQCIARTIDPSLPYGVARKTLPESVYENSYFTYTAYALVSGNGFVDIDPRALDLPNFATSNAGYSQTLRRRSLANIPFSENLLYAGAGERFRRFLACNGYKIYSHKTGLTYTVNNFPNASDNTSFWRVLTAGVDLTGISGDYVTFFVDTRESSPHLLERLTGLTINLNGPQPLAAGASGATPNQFLAGSATITRVRGVRQSNSGAAVVSVYVSNQTDGSYNVGTPFPYPGMKLGVLTFAAGARNSGGSAFVWDATNVPGGSFLYGHNNANLSFNAEVDSGTIGEHGAIHLQMF